MARRSTPPAGDASGHLDEQLCFALYAASTAMTRVYRPLLEELGLTYPQYLVLLVLWEKGPIRLGRIADALGLATHAVSPIIDRLEEAGLVRRVKDPEDARAVLVDLTKAGRNLESEGVAVRDQVRRRTALKTSEITRLRSELHKLVEILNED
ncbi:MAG: MarR family transcriptional regulator [Actinobacteria bacterium]|nr:MarR family transcriptional regulator [Actinomycetota bacterium]